MRQICQQGMIKAATVIKSCPLIAAKEEQQVLASECMHLSKQDNQNDEDKDKDGESSKKKNFLSLGKFSAIKVI